MDISELSIKEIKKLLAENPEPEIVASIAADERKGVQTAYKAYCREVIEQERVRGLYEFEAEAYAQGLDLVAGVDEVGRGPLAGPVVVAAVILPKYCIIPKLNDSKKVSEATREKLYKEIIAQAIAYKVAVVDEKTIDRVNIYQATLNGMYEAIYGLNPGAQKVLVDAMPLENLEIPVKSIIKGDAKSASIAAASIIAKVTRDNMMREYAQQYPEYAFESNKGYGTAEHLAALEKYGVCPIHRQSFEPIKSMVEF